ncbi:MAG TPA: DnaJ C-terminal domain-containing protein [Polyangia bacterium]|jgi:DnaJ-class molecular chaperone|nr:DnaJ C-terminal domain-containing protein [Polyangia bacterium]
MKDLHKILGVPENADDATIKKAYRKLAKEFHPDVTGGDKKKTERFKEINEAYDVLSDAEKRAAYLRLKHAPVRPDGMPEGFDPETFARTFGGGRGGVQFGNGGVDLGDVFSSLFGDARARGGGAWGRSPRQQPPRGSDMAGSVEVTFAEAALGTRRSVQNGAGATVEVGIPGGVESGTRLRVTGQGGPAPGRGGTAGDLYLDIAVAPDKHLRRNESDVELAVPISVGEAALGAKVQVPTVEGPVTVTIPPGTSSGAKLRLRGRGIKKADGTRGDQICRVEIVVPKGVADDAELKKLFEEIAKRTTAKSVRDF